MLTGDTFEYALTCAYNIGMIERNETYHQMDFTDELGGIVKMKSILENLKWITDGKQVKPHNANQKDTGYHTNPSLLNEMSSTDENFYLCDYETLKRLNDQILFISGDSLDIITNNKYLDKHFVFLCSLCRTVIGYNMSDCKKAYIVRTLKKIGELKYTKWVTVAVGDGYNDISMLKEADVGIQLLNQ